MKLLHLNPKCHHLLYLSIHPSIHPSSWVRLQSSDIWKDNQMYITNGRLFSKGESIESTAVFHIKLFFFPPTSWGSLDFNQTSQMPGHRHGPGHSYRGQLFGPHRSRTLYQIEWQIWWLLCQIACQSIYYKYIYIYTKWGSLRNAYWRLNRKCVGGFFSLFWLNLHSEIHFEEPLWEVSSLFKPTWM